MMQTEIDLLEQQHTQLNELSELLKSELDAFTQRDIDSIYDIAELKSNLLQKIQQVDQMISQAENLETLKQDADFKHQVEQLDIQLKEIKVQNSINERVIRASLNNVTRLKQSILSLKNSNAMTYDKKAQTQTQTLGKGIKA